MISYTTYIPVASSNTSNWGTASWGQTFNTYNESLYYTAPPATGITAYVGGGTSLDSSADATASVYATRTNSTVSTTFMGAESGYAGAGAPTASGSTLTSVTGVRSVEIGAGTSAEVGWAVYTKTSSFEIFPGFTITMGTGTSFYGNYDVFGVRLGLESFTSVWESSFSQDSLGFTTFQRFMSSRTGTMNGVNSTHPYFTSTSYTVGTSTLYYTPPGIYETTTSTTYLAGLGSSGSTTAGSWGAGNWSESFEMSLSTVVNTWKFALAVTTAVSTYSISVHTTNSTGTTTSSSNTTSYKTSISNVTWTGTATKCVLVTVSTFETDRLLHATASYTRTYAQTIASASSTTTQAATETTWSTRWSYTFGDQSGLYRTTTSQISVTVGWSNKALSIPAQVVLYEAGVSTDTSRGNEIGYEFSVATSNGILTDIASTVSTKLITAAQWTSTRGILGANLTGTIFSYASTSFTYHWVSTKSTTVHVYSTSSTESTRTVTNYSQWPFPVTTATETYSASVMGTGTALLAVHDISVKTIITNSVDYIWVGTMDSLGADPWTTRSSGARGYNTYDGVSYIRYASTYTISSSTILVTGGTIQGHIIVGADSATHLALGPVLNTVVTTLTTLTLTTSANYLVLSQSFTQTARKNRFSGDFTTVTDTWPATSSVTSTFTVWSSVSTVLSWTSSGIRTKTTASYSTSRGGTATSHTTTTSYTATFSPLPTTTSRTTTVTDTCSTSTTSTATTYTCAAGTTNSTVTSSISTTANTTSTATWSFSTATTTTQTNNSSTVTTTSSSTAQVYGLITWLTSVVWQQAYVNMTNSWGNSFECDGTSAISESTRISGKSCSATTPIYGRMTPAAKQGFRYPYLMDQTDTVYRLVSFTIPLMGMPIYSTTTFDSSTSTTSATSTAATDTVTTSTATSSETSYIFTMSYLYSTSGGFSAISNYPAPDWSETQWRMYPWLDQGRSVWILPSFAITYSATSSVSTTSTTSTATTTSTAATTATTTASSATTTTNTWGLTAVSTFAQTLTSYSSNSTTTSTGAWAANISETLTWVFSSASFTVTRSGAALTLTTGNSAGTAYTAHGLNGQSTSISFTGSYALDDAISEVDDVGWGDLMVFDLFANVAAGKYDGGSTGDASLRANEFVVGPFPIDVEFYNMDSRWISLVIDGVSVDSPTGKQARGQTIFTLGRGLQCRISSTIASGGTYDGFWVVAYQGNLENANLVRLLGGLRYSLYSYSGGGLSETQCRVGIRAVGAYPALGSGFSSKVAGGYPYAAGVETIFVDPLQFFERVINSETSSSTLDTVVGIGESFTVPLGEAYGLDVIQPYRADAVIRTTAITPVSVQLYPTA